MTERSRNDQQTIYSSEYRKSAPLNNAIIKLTAYEDAMPLERVQELAQAEKDGRLVILPDAKYTDSDGEKALRKAMWACGNTNNSVTRYTADAIAEKLCREAENENSPLTLEELREMDGEFVWCEMPIKGQAPFYGIVHGNMVTGYRPGNPRPIHLDAGERGGYGIAWFAYRRRPEEGIS